MINIGHHIKQSINNRVNAFAPQFMAFAFFGLINYPIYYLIWIYFNGHSYENFTLRMVATCLCLGLLFKDKWPKALKEWFPVYWYITLTYCLSFFFTFMFLHNPTSSVWIMTFTSVIFWLVLLADLASAFLMLFIGGGTALILFFLLNNNFSQMPSYLLQLTPEYIGCLIVIAIFANNKDSAEKSKLDTAKAIGASLAHELRTPLSTIEYGIKGAHKYFNVLLDAYQTAKERKLIVNEISPQHLEILLTLFDDIQRETHFSDVFIDMLLFNANDHVLEKETYRLNKISTCVAQALQRYPKTYQQDKLIHWDDNTDFVFYGADLLIIHTLFNLIKNALYQIEKERKGEIYIWASTSRKYNVLHFKDTASGMPSHIQARLFQRFVSDKRNGTGLGLAFCKTVMQGLGGDIKCRSIEGEYTEFLLCFPINQ